MKRFNKLPKTPQGIQAVKASIKGKNVNHTLREMLESSNGYGIPLNELKQLIQ